MQEKIVWQNYFSSQKWAKNRIFCKKADENICAVSTCDCLLRSTKIVLQAVWSQFRPLGTGLNAPQSPKGSQDDQRKN